MVLLKQKQIMFESSNHFVLYIDFYWLRRHILSPYMDIDRDCDIARDCVMVWEGIGDNEAIAIQLSGTNPKVIIVANYGTQPNSFGVSIPSNNLMEI